jgi:hypothetical protein
MKSNDRNSPLWKFGFSCWLGLQLAAQSLSAQSGPAPSAGDSATPTANVVVSTKDMPTLSPELQAMQAAQAIRAGIASSVASGAITPEAGINRLQAMSSATGLSLDADADRGGAAIEVGLRLRVIGKVKEAEKFFLQAETALTAVIERTVAKDAAKKADYLSERAFIRAQFLNRAALAKTDMDMAQQLKPGDRYLESLRIQLSRDKGADFAATPKN